MTCIVLFVKLDIVKMLKSPKKFLGEIYDKYCIDTWLRVHKRTTAILGPRYRRKRGLYIEIDLTYRCNLKCINCNRSCRQAPSNEEITVGQIQKFIKESVDNKVKWEKIRVLGGEPTLHQNLLEILGLLLEYKKSSSHDTLIELVSNGCGKKINKVLSVVPEGIEIENTSKTTEYQAFTPFNIAPKDIPRYSVADFSNGCYIPAYCGIGLTRYGYYCCAVAGSIDRVFGFDIARKSIPLPPDLMVDHMEVFCRLCGHFITRYGTCKDEVMSPTWKEAYRKFQEAKPNLSLY